MRPGKFTLLLLCLFIIACKASQAQLAKAQILKRYINIDTSDVNKDAMLVLYTNYTYINFGIYSDEKENDAFVWYSCGTWMNNDTSVVLRSKFDLFEMNHLIKDIKLHYKRRKDHVLIESSYEFVKELSKEKLLDVRHEYILDQKKMITYSETNI